jgi:tetratricopeptide (TPR) repeat protein
MSKRSNIMLLSTVGVFMIGVLLYQIPAVNSRLEWRLERISTYVNGIVHPAGPVPTALPETSVAQDPPTATAPATLPATPTILPTATATAVPLPLQVFLPAPAFEDEKKFPNNCGPATLTMALRVYGWTGDQFDISKVIKPLPDDRNVNPDELVYWVRNYAGWLNAEYRVNGSLALLKELLAAGFPVMIEETFKFDEPFWPKDDLWAAHYVLVTGYDDSAQTFTIQDAFHGPDLSVPYDTLEGYWEPFNHLYLLIYPPDQQSQLSDILGPDWDPDTNRQNALEASRAATVSHPDDAFAWFNYGSNLVYFERYNEAVAAYDQARQIGLPQRMFRYQFGPFIADFNTNRLDDLMEITKYTMELANSYSEEAWLWQGWALYRSGDTSGAVAKWRKALSIRPGYIDAINALKFVGAQP